MTGPAARAAPARRIDLYYLVGTPLFAAADYFFGISVRAAFFAGWPAARYAYYGVCFGCGIWAWRKPAMTRIIALTESQVNIALLIFSIMMNYYGVIDRVAADQPVGSAFGPNYAVNLAFSAGMLMFAYFRSRRPAAHP
jgi:hypothetical protein